MSGHGDPGARAPRGGADRRGAVEGVGPVSLRAPVGHGPRGLQPQRRRLEPLHARPSPLARLPLGRGRASPGSATTASGCASRWRSGTAPTRSSRSGCSGSPTARATTARTPRSTGSTSTRTPTHSYLKCLYKYPQRAFPYERPRGRRTARRGKQDYEYELLDTGIFDEDRYFDVVVEYAKAAHDDILMRVTAHNRGPDAGDAARAADAVVPQHVVVGRRARSRRSRSTATRCSRATRRSASGASRPTRRSCSARTRTGAKARDRRARVDGAPLDAAPGTKCAAHHVLEIPAGELGRGPRAADARATPRSTSTRSSPRASRRPTRSTPRSSRDTLDADQRAGDAPGARRACCGASSTTSTTSTAGCASTTSTRGTRTRRTSATSPGST